MGQRLKIKDLTDPEFQKLFTDEQVFKAIKEGFKDDTRKTMMKLVEGISDDEIVVLISPVRTLVKPE